MAKIIFTDPAAGTELVLPVTPEGYTIDHGRETVTKKMAAVGEMNQPGGKSLFKEELDFLLPGQDYPFNQAGAGTNPFVYLEQLEKWSDNGTVVRFIVSGTPVNAAVLIENVSYSEYDGTRDVKCTVKLRQYRPFTAVINTATGAGSKRADDGGKVTEELTYTVKKGDTLSAISKSFYGSSGYYKEIAAYNGISNYNLIYPGQVLKLPVIGNLKAVATGSVTGGNAMKPSAAGLITVTMKENGYSSYKGNATYVWSGGGKSGSGKWWGGDSFQMVKGGALRLNWSGTLTGQPATIVCKDTSFTIHGNSSVQRFALGNVPCTTTITVNWKKATE